MILLGVSGDQPWEIHFFSTARCYSENHQWSTFQCLVGLITRPLLDKKSAAVTFWTQKKRDESRCGVYPRPKPIPDPCIKFYMCSGPNAINHPPNQHFWWYKLSPTVGLWDWVYHRTGTVSNSPWIFCAGKFPQREDFAAKGQKLISRKKKKSVSIWGCSMIFTTYFGCHCSIYDLGQRIMVVVSLPSGND